MRRLTSKLTKSRSYKSGYFQPKVVYMKADASRENSIIRYIGNRVINYNRNMLVGVVGSTGSGKSWAGCSMAEIYSKMFGIPFDANIHVISSLKEMLLLITGKHVDKKIRFGSVIVFDEPQVEGNARDWQSDMNKALGQLISTFRNQRLVVFFCVPYLEMIDKQSRVLFHGEFKVLGFDRSSGITKIKPRFLEYNKKKNDFYRKRLIIIWKEGIKSKMNRTKLSIWEIPKPSKEVRDVYESKKKKFTDDLNVKLLKNIEMQEQIDEGKNKSDEFFKIKELYEKYGENYEELLKAMPHLNAFTIEKYLQFIKKGKNSKGKVVFEQKKPKKFAQERDLLTCLT